jgi:hypothetical protein
MTVAGWPSTLTRLGPQEASTGKLGLVPGLHGVRPIRSARRHRGRGQTILQTTLDGNSVVQRKIVKAIHEIPRSAKCLLQAWVGDQRS